MGEERFGPGMEIAGRYRLEELLGKGGMGEVWRAEHLALHAPVAIKLIDPGAMSDPTALQRFMQEARAAAALQSPHVVRTTDFGIDGSVPFIAMELLQGESLQRRLERETRLSPAFTARVIRHVARAIQKAHDAGIVHRDLKPDNVFIVNTEDEELVKVLDFGVAKAVGGVLGEGHGSTRTGALLGTPFYMSPEQAQGERSIDHRSDLWSLGVIAFECMTGRLPFEGAGVGGIVVKICTAPIPVPSSLTPVPHGFDAWFQRALERDPDARFANAKQMADALVAVLTPEAGATGQYVPVSPAPVGPNAMLAQPHYSPGLDRTTGQTSAADIDIPMRSGRMLWIVALAGAGLVAVVALLVFGGKYATRALAKDQPADTTATEQGQSSMTEIVPLVDSAHDTSSDQAPPVVESAEPQKPAVEKRTTKSEPLVKSSTKASTAKSATTKPSAGSSTGKPVGKPGTCVPGATQLCVGAGACRGGQTCQPGGMVWGACDCGKGKK